MAKSLSGLWLRSLRSLGKTQRAQTRLLESLLAKPSRSQTVRKPKAKPATLPKNATPSRPNASASPRKPAARATAQGAALPGTWKPSYFSATSPTRAVSSKRMAYWLYLPSGAAVQTVPLPLVVMLHGCQQTAPQIATATRMNQLAERKGFAVLYPQQSVGNDAHRCWPWYRRQIQSGLGEVQTIADMIMQVQQRHGLDASRTYAAGLSAGAALATILALRHPQLIAALGVHSGPVFGTADSAITGYRLMQRGANPVYAAVASDAARSIAAMLPPAGGMPAIIIHGDRDAVVRPVNARQLGQQLHIINAAAITREQPVRRSVPARTGGRSPCHAYTTCTHYAGRRPQLVQCEIAALGHAWSGGDDSEHFSTATGPDATLMMWTFFARHRHGG